jgi:hypothetical protein
MSLHAIPPLFPESSFGRAKVESLTGLHFFESARQALQALATELERQYGRVLYVLPAYTCDSVIASLLAIGADMAFVDVDGSLDFNLDELGEIVDQSTHVQIVLVPTSLFGAPIRDYKGRFPQLLVLEDRAQSLLSPTSTADFQMVSLGVGKQVSTFGGGALYSPRMALNFAGLPKVQRSFIAGAFAQFAMTQGLKWLWPVLALVQARSVGRERAIAEFAARTPRLLGGSKARWIGHCLQAMDVQRRVELSNRYRDRLPPPLQFDIPAGVPYLRYPVRASLRLTGVSAGSMYHNAVTFSEQHRHRECPGARQLLACSLLPTHRLVSQAHQGAYLTALLALHGTR